MRIMIRCWNIGGRESEEEKRGNYLIGCIVKHGWSTGCNVKPGWAIGCNLKPGW